MLQKRLNISELQLQRRGRDYRHTPCDTVIPKRGGQISNMGTRTACAIFYPVRFARASSVTLPE